MFRVIRIGGIDKIEDGRIFKVKQIFRLEDLFHDFVQYQSVKF